MTDLTQAIAAAIGTVAVAAAVLLLYAVITLAAEVAAVIAGLHYARPLLARVPRVARIAADTIAGTRRLFVRPAQRVMRTGVRVRSVLWLCVLAVIVVATVPSIARVPLTLLVCWLAGHSWQDRQPGWWSHRRLVGALVTAGVLRAPKDGEPPASVSFRGAPRHGDHGTTVTIGLPDGRGLSDVVSKRESLAAALHVPSARLEVTQGEDDPANVVRLHVGHGDRTEVAATVANAAATTWQTPVRVGRDTRGEPVHLATHEANSLVAGRPGSGKTSLSRIVLGHYLLDPTTIVMLLDGKGSTEDYGAARPLCARFISGTDDNAVSDTLAMLTEALDIVRQRNTAGGSHPGLLVLLEELQDVRAAASKTERDQLDATLGRIVRMGRAVSVHVVVSTQRPTVDDLPAGTRNLISQRLALMLRNGSDAALVLGAAPSLSLPTRRGQALYTDGGPVRGVLLDRLTDDAWRAVCARAAALRPTAVRPERNHGSGLPTGTTVPPPPSALDPLYGAVLHILRDADPTGITATELHARLPEWTRAVCPTARDLGVQLARSGGRVERVNRGQARVWRLTEHCRTSDRPLPDHCRSTAAPTDGDSRNGDPHAQTAPADSLGTPTPTLPTPRTPAHTPR